MNRPYREITRCRLCGNAALDPILNLGIQSLTGVFPKEKDRPVTSGPLELVKCREEEGESCGLVQLKQSYRLDEMYGENYGYRSGLNPSMVAHLQAKVKRILDRVSLGAEDRVLDIGSNDATLLRAYPKGRGALIGIDPSGKKFSEYYPDHVRLIPEFFSKETVKRHFGDRKMKVVTSIAMFYDLEDPLDFMRQVGNVLDDEGIWVFEQSYLPAMLTANAYDTVCHEHLEYYRLKQIKWMTDRAGLKIVDVEFNDVNGGSFSVTAAKSRSPRAESAPLVDKILRDEEREGLGTPAPYERFRADVDRHREDLLALIRKINADGKKILGYGASTKGNVILQFCGLTSRQIPFIAEVNRDKFGSFTPGSRIPIISEQEAKGMKPDFFLVLPWHFKRFFLEKERDYLTTGGRLIFPLPRIEVVASPLKNAGDRAC
jgi:hypothetical protein